MEKKLKVKFYTYDHKQKLGKFNRVNNQTVIYRTNLAAINIINGLANTKQVTKLFINYN